MLAHAASVKRARGIERDCLSNAHCLVTGKNTGGRILRTAAQRGQQALWNRRRVGAVLVEAGCQAFRYRGLAGDFAASTNEDAQLPSSLLPPRPRSSARSFETSGAILHPPGPCGGTRRLGWPIARSIIDRVRSFCRCVSPLRRRIRHAVERISAEPSCAPQPACGQFPAAAYLCSCATLSP